MKNLITKQTIVLLLTLMVTGNVLAQSTQGTDFLLTFGGNGDAKAEDVELQVRVTAKKACQATLSFTNPTAALLPVVLNIPANGAQTYSLSLAEKVAVYFHDEEDSPNSGSSHNSLRITADDTISVFAFKQRYGGCEATQVLPLNSLGMDYYHIDYHSNSIGYSGYMVIANEDGTEIHENNTPKATLSQGEVYYNYVMDDDLTGHHITSSKPIAYFVTNTQTEIPSGSSFIDILFQQMFPVEHWGTQFVVPNTTQTKARIRVVAAQNGTNLILSPEATLVNNTGSGSLHIDAGQFTELEIQNNAGATIISDKPVGVCLYTVGAEYSIINNEDETGDPSHVWIAPVEQMTNNLLVAPFIPAGNTRLTVHYALLVTSGPGKEKTTVIKGGQPIETIGDTITWKNIDATSGYSFGFVKLSENTTYLFDNPNGLFVYGYGIGEEVAYFYSAGLRERILSLIWTPETTGSDRNNWHNPANWTPHEVPSEYHNVYIPGNLDDYPDLKNTAICRNIYFMQGGEIGRPDLLKYKKAYVQLNFGLAQTNQITDKDDKDLIFKSGSTADRMLYSASVSENTLARERWYMLSAPLHGIASGDMDFGGFPLTFIKKFGPVVIDGNDYPVGTWSNSFSSTNETLAPTEGFTFYMYGYGNPYDNTGCEEYGSFDDLNDLDFFPYRNGENYGIRRVNGILELPFFSDTTNLYAHRTQLYDAFNNQSAFFVTNNDIDGTQPFNSILNRTEMFKREDHEGNYRFIADSLDANNQWIFRPVIYHSGAGLGSEDDFMVGNPYMSSIDIVEFLKDNSATIQSNFKLWDGNNFISYEVSGNTITATPEGDPVRYIAPMQGFFLTTLTDYAGTGNAVKFDVGKISTTRPAEEPVLRNSVKAQENILRVKADNNLATSYILIGCREGASNEYRENEDVRKLFSPFDYVPELYSLAGTIPVDINFINNKGEITVPLGIKTGYTGKIELTFTGMDNYIQATKIEFIDALENRTIDLTGKVNHVYDFNNEKTGIQNGRFSLHIQNSMTAMPEINSTGDLKVYGDSRGIYVISSSSDPVQKITVYDLQGRKIYENDSNAKYYPLQENTGHSPVIVSVTTKNQTKTVKL